MVAKDKVNYKRDLVGNNLNKWIEKEADMIGN